MVKFDNSIGLGIISSRQFMNLIVPPKCGGDIIEISIRSETDDSMDGITEFTHERNIGCVREFFTNNELKNDSLKCPESSLKKLSHIDTHLNKLGNIKNTCNKGNDKSKIRKISISKLQSLSKIDMKKILNESNKNRIISCN